LLKKSERKNEQVNCLFRPNALFLAKIKAIFGSSKSVYASLTVFLCAGFFLLCRKAVLLHSFLKKGQNFGAGEYWYFAIFKLQKICQLLAPETYPAGEMLFGVTKRSGMPFR